MNNETLPKTLPKDIAGHLPDLRRFAASLTREPAEREDLVQETLLRALEKQETLREPSGLRSWLFQIMQNRLVDLRRSALSRARREAQSEWLREDHATGGQESAVRLGQIRRAFGALPEDQRRVLELVALDGMTVRAAADHLSIPTGTVLSRLARGRAALRAFEDDTSTLTQKERTDDA